MAIIDLVKWNPQGSVTIYAYKYPENNLSTYTQLIVQETQEAVLFSKGQIVGKFGPGKHTLSTENLPLLRSLFGIPFGGQNPFTAEVWFVNKLQPYNIDWSVNRMDIHDNDYNTGIPLVANGRYGLKINNTEKFLLKLVGTKNSFDEHDLTDQFLGEVSTKTKSALMQFMMANKIGIKQISAFLDTISENLKNVMLPFWDEIGFDLTKFYITSIEIDGTNEVGRRVLDAISRQSAQAIGGYTWQQSQAFEVAKDAVEGISNSGNGGLLGALMATNLMGGLGGGNMQPQYNQPTYGPNNNSNVNQSQSNSANAIREVYCSNCSKKFSNNLKFCPHCGDEYCPCPKCGTDNEKNAKRCVSCGQNLNANQSICTNCNSTLPAGASFCGNCGKPQSENSCTRCGAELSPSIKFCPKCGQKNN